MKKNESSQDVMVHDLQRSMGQDQMSVVLNTEPHFDKDNNRSYQSPPAIMKNNRKSRQVVTMQNTNSGPVAILNINRDNLSLSHRQVNNKIKNARDVLRVGNPNLQADRYEKYESPANKTIRVTSAVGKRTASAARLRNQ